jgi:hypothetical protein
LRLENKADKNRLNCGLWKLLGGQALLERFSASEL